MRLPKVRVVTKGKKSEIYVDERKLEGVTKVEFVHSSQENKGLPRLQIELKATNVTLETEVLPNLPYPYNSLYVSMQELIENGIVEKDTLNDYLKAKKYQSVNVLAEEL